MRNAHQVARNAHRVARLRQTRIEAGLCPRCGKVPPEDGYRMCRACRRLLAAYAVARARKQKAAGRCIGCGAPAAPYVHCPRCRKRRAEQYLANKEARP